MTSITNDLLDTQDALNYSKRHYFNFKAGKSAAAYQKFGEILSVGTDIEIITPELYLDLFGNIEIYRGFISAISRPNTLVKLLFHYSSERGQALDHLSGVIPLVDLHQCFSDRFKIYWSECFCPIKIWAEIDKNHIYLEDKRRKGKFRGAMICFDIRGEGVPFVVDVSMIDLASIIDLAVENATPNGIEIKLSDYRVV